MNVDRSIGRRPAALGWSRCRLVGVRRRGAEPDRRQCGRRHLGPRHPAHRPRERPRRQRWRRALLVLVPSLAVLGLIIGASYNSYRQSLGPPGDHSVENASPDIRALWQAAGDGDVDEILRLTTQTCADPWVRFPVGNGRLNAKGYAENRVLELPGDREAPYGRIADILGDYMDVWYERCGRADRP